MKKLFVVFLLPFFFFLGCNLGEGEDVSLVTVEDTVVDYVTQKTVYKVSSIIPVDQYDAINAGSSVAISGDGKTVGIGADESLASFGEVFFVRKDVDGRWNYLGKYSAPLFDRLGYSMAISGDGQIAYVGAPFATISALSEAGYIAKLSLTSGVGLIVNMNPEPFAQSSRFGTSVAVSKDGRIMIGGKPNYTNSHSQQGGFVYSNEYIAAYQGVDGQPIVSDNLGNNVDISDDGSVLATSDDNSNLYEPGSVRIYVENAGWMSYINMTSLGGGDYDHYGKSISMTGDAKLIAIGAPGINGAAGLVEVNGINVATDSFTRLNTINPNLPAGSRFGEKVALSDDKSTLAISAPSASVNGVGLVGKVFMYKQSATGWELFDTIEPETVEGSYFFGSSLSISNNGKTLVIGSPLSTTERPVIIVEYTN